MRIVRSVSGMIFIAIAVTISSIAWAGPPAWVAGDSAEYPNDQYLVGRGTGSTEQEAQNRARGDLATIFEVRIEVATENTTTVAESGKNQQVNRIATQQVSAKTDKVISGINIAKIWRDPVTKDFHALAVLSRAQAASSLTDELTKIDQEVQQELQAADNVADPLRKIGMLSRTLQASIKRDGYQAMLKVIDPSGRGIQTPISQLAIQRRIDDTLKQVHISPESVDDAGTREFASILKGGLAASGFLASSHAAADLVLAGRLTLTDLGNRGGWYWMRATVEVSLIEKATGRVRGQQTWPVKAAARDAKTARTRVLMEIEKLLKQELRSTIIGFAAS